MTITTPRFGDKLLLLSATLAVWSAIPLILTATGKFPHVLNEGFWGLIASAGMAVTVAGCLVITLTMLIAVFRARGSFASRSGWLLLILISGWFGAALFYFAEFRPTSRQ